jgi:SAM-dependent methyltransferase
MKSNAEHWDKIFDRTEDTQLGWYEKEATTTLELLGKIPAWESSLVFLPGAGTSGLIDDLLAKGARLVLNDISGAALDKVRKRLAGRNDGVEWLCQDIARPFPPDVPMVDIWIDRAVLHFLTDEEAIKGYFRNLNAVMKPGGHALFAEFSTSGAKKCAGLTLHRYSVDELTARLGTSFELLSSFEHTYFNPNGDPRPYIYALYKK